MISLPKDWLEQNNLEKGDQLVFSVQENGGLGVYPKKKIIKGTKKKIINIDENTISKHVLRQIIAAYLNGYPTIHIKSGTIFSTEQQRSIREKLRELDGCRIIKSSSKEIVIQNDVENIHLDVLKGIYQAHTIIISMFEDLIEALIKQNVDQASSVIPLDGDVDYLYFLHTKLLRYALSHPRIMGNLSLTNLEAVNLYTILYVLEKIADNLRDIGKNVGAYLKKGAIEPYKETYDFCIETFKKTFGIYKDSFKAFFNEMLDLGNAAFDQVKEIMKARLKVVRDLQMQGAEFFRSVKDWNEFKTFFEINEIPYLIESIFNLLEKIAQFSTTIVEVGFYRIFK